ncbi:MAG: hybrid sensor histidine kinase/response regulator [Deltaproteobacteria bacterium]|nr:hybrid sensor histidine kinase/response regulator [Deltaproteobacteria bacterium]
MIDSHILSSQNTILLVDDEEMVRDLLRRVLERDGHNVLSAASKEEAFEQFTSNAVDLLLVDKNLPDGSGLEFIEAARNLEFDGESIVITGYSDTESAIKSVELNVFRYIKKPFDLDALRNDINRALETAALRRDLAQRTHELEVANADLMEALEQIKESDRRRIQAERLASIGYLSAGIAHEINNPLSLLSMTIPFTVSELEKVIRTNATAQSPKKVNEELETLLKNLGPTQEAVDLLMQLSSDLHSLGRSDDIKAQPVKLSNVVNSALRIVRHRVKHKATVTVNIPDALTITGKTNRLIQVFINLLTNAGRAIRENMPDRNYIKINGYEDDAYAVIEVTDSGIGIPPEHLEMIFDRFVSLSGLGPSEGSGIGLSIVKELVEEHGGTVDVISAVGEGTSFIVKFPLKRILKSSPPPMAQAAFSRSPNEFVKAHRMILFVDSNREHLDAYANSFGQLHDVRTASSFNDAIFEIELCDGILDIVICETTRGMMEFNEFYQATIAKYPELTGHFICTGDENADSEGLKRSSIPFLQRPFRPAELLAAIYRIPPRRKLISNIPRD